MINFIIMKIRDIGLFVSKRRKALGVNQRELALLCGVSEHALCNLERGAGNPTLKLVTAVAEALGLELDLKAKDMEAT
jgi:transcriptional regulator with XRE-family HTH domain